MVTRGGPIGCTGGASRRRGRLRLATRVVRRRGPYLPDGRWSRRADQRRVRIHTGCPRRGQPVWIVEGQVRLAPARWWTSGVDRVAVRRIHSRQPGGARTRTAGPAGNRRTGDRDKGSATGRLACQAHRDPVQGSAVWAVGSGRRRELRSGVPSGLRMAPSRPVDRLRAQFSGFAGRLSARTAPRPCNARVTACSLTSRAWLTRPARPLGSSTRRRRGQPRL